MQWSYLFLTLILMGNVATAQNLEVVLQIGETHILKGQGAPRAQKTNSLQLKPIRGGVEVLGVKAGSSEVRIGKKTWTLQILSKTQHQTMVALKKWTQARLGLKVKVEQAKVFLVGKLFRANDWLGLIKVCAGCDYTAELEVSEELESEISRELEKTFRRRGLAVPSLRWNPQGEWLVAKKTGSRNLKSLAAALGLEVSPQEEIVDVAPMIRTQIFVMEVRREKTRQWGIEWPESVSAQILPKFQNPMEQLMITAHALEKSGEARILASPALLCRSGQEAEFLAGGEFPIKVFNRHQSGVIWRKYGILVKVKPKADRFGKMSISLETEVSNIDGSRVVDGVPGLLTNRVLSHFDLSKSRTIAISGLIRNDESNSVKGIPGLSQIPILGALFSSREFRENKTELVILVKPETLNLSADSR